MSLGQSNWSVKAGGGQIRASSQQLARAAVHLDVSPLGTANTLIPIGDPSSIQSLLDGRLAELCAFTAQKGQSKYAMPVNPSVAGVLGPVVQNGFGVGTIVAAMAPYKAITTLCILGGAVGVATFRFSLDGGVTYGPVTLSAATVKVPGTYTTLSFAAATYVATKTHTAGIDGTMTPGSGWVGVVTQASSPIDDYEIVCTVLKTGAPGATNLQVSLDNGNSTFIASALVPSGGVVVLPGTGIFLTCAGASFTQFDTYTFLAVGPNFSTTDLNNALTALRAISTLQITEVHVGSMPSSAAGAFSAAATLDAAVLAAFSSNNFDWNAICDCPSKTGGMRITSPLTGRKHLRPLSWMVMEIYGRTDPKDEIAATAVGPLKAFFPAGSTTIVGPGDIVAPSASAIYDTADTDSVIITARGGDLSGRTAVCVGGRDENLFPGLDDVQLNTARSYTGGSLAAYLSITAGVCGLKNLTTNSSFIDSGAFRALNVMIAALRPVAQALLGQRPKVNPDGTISETAAGGYDTVLDGAAKRSMGLVRGGDFADPQASFVSASVLRSSQLGQNPKRLDIAYTFQPLGEITAVGNNVAFSGVLSLVS